MSIAPEKKSSMTNVAKLNAHDMEIELPIVVGTEGATDPETWRAIVVSVSWVAAMRLN